MWLSTWPQAEAHGRSRQRPKRRAFTFVAVYRIGHEDERSGYLAPSGAFYREFHRLLSRADCPRIRFHDLRHTAGLFLTRSVGVVVASRILGHANPMITMTLYGHSQQQDYEKASSAMAGILGAPEGIDLRENGER